MADSAAAAAAIAAATNAGERARVIKLCKLPLPLCVSVCFTACQCPKSATPFSTARPTTQQGLAQQGLAQQAGGRAAAHSAGGRPKLLVASHGAMSLGEVRA